MSCKKLLLLLQVPFALLLCACTKDEVELPDLLKEKQYVSSGLKAYYCGIETPGKSVTLIPSNGGNINNITLRCEGATDLSQLSSIGLNGYGPGPGLIPGSPVVDLPVALTEKKDGYSFSSSWSTDFCSFKYSGNITESLATINISDVELHNKDFAGTVWKPVPFKQSGLQVESTPFYILWEIDPAVGIDIDLSGLLKLLVTAPVIPTYHDTAYSSISQLLSSSLQTVAFLENGNIIVRYYSSVGGATQLATLQAPTLQYVVKDSNEILIYPNPTSLFGLWLVAQSDSAGIPDISFKEPKKRQESADSEGGDESLKQAFLPLIKEMIPVILEMTRQGIPLEITKTESGVNIFLDTQTILTILNQVARIISEKPEILEGLLGNLDVSPELSNILPQIQEILPQLQTILEKTTRIEFGLSFLPFEK